jgi:pimeloyl-ACP methyl ester carboxylesterase
MVPHQWEAQGRPTLLCLPGLTRNARDFEPLAARLGGKWRLICPDLRGRGESAHAPDPMTYVPPTYVDDLHRLADEISLGPVIAIGTSLGGILTMLLKMAGRIEIAGAVLNDIGPVLEPAGLARIRTYVGRSASWPTWLHAARSLAELNAGVYPDYRLDDWIAMTKRVCRLTRAGRIVFDYDMKIAEPFRLAPDDPAPDLWPAFQALHDIPTTLCHGALSDLLSASTCEQMAKQHADLNYVTVPRVGHAPVLDEPAAIAAIEGLLGRFT